MTQERVFRILTTMAMMCFGISALTTGAIIRMGTNVETDYFILWFFALVSLCVMLFFPCFPEVAIGGIINWFCAGYVLSGMDLSGIINPELQMYSLLMAIFAILGITHLVLVEKINPQVIEVIKSTWIGNLPLLFIWAYVLQISIDVVVTFATP